MNPILITGAGGYIGSVLTRMLLEQGREVVAVDRFLFGRDTLPPEGGGLKVIETDIRALEESIFQGVAAVIDLAALSNDPAGELDPKKTWEINHRARVRLARLAKTAGVQRYILPSSCSVYGFQDGVLDESSPANPLTTYAKANLEAERGVLPMADEHFTVVAIRQATVYGFSYRMRFDLAVNGMVKGLVKNGKIPILRDGTQWRPFVHVKDTSRAMIALLKADAGLVNGQIFNVGTDHQNVQIMPLAETVAKAIGMRCDYEWYGEPDHRSYQVSFRKIHEKLGYQTLYGLHDGAVEVYEALKRGALDADDPRTITVQWYKHLLAEGVAL
jgi:nucleoside-diphosphate-sugar epimerase